jgi:hypothetical protein
VSSSDRRQLERLIPLLLLALASCGKNPEAAAPKTPAAAESRSETTGDAPATHAIVAREGDHVAVIVDVAAADARGRKVAAASFEVEAPAGAIRASPPVRSDDGLTLEVRIPDGTPSVKLVGSSEGGASWSTVIRTSLGPR